MWKIPFYTVRVKGSGTRKVSNCDSNFENNASFQAANIPQVTIIASFCNFLEWDKLSSLFSGTKVRRIFTIIPNWELDNGRLELREICIELSIPPLQRPPHFQADLAIEFLQESKWKKCSNEMKVLSHSFSRNVGT